LAKPAGQPGHVPMAGAGVAIGADGVARCATGQLAQLATLRWRSLSTKEVLKLGEAVVILVPATFGARAGRLGKPPGIARHSKVHR
jgi:hypothetical protein